MFVVTSTARANIIVFFLSLLILFILLVSIFPNIFEVSAIQRFLFCHQTLCSVAETLRIVVQVPFLFSMKYFDRFLLFFLATQPHNSISLSQILLSQFTEKGFIMFASTLLNRISDFSESRSCKDISSLNFSTIMVFGFLFLLSFDFQLSVGGTSLTSGVDSKSFS